MVNKEKIIAMREGGKIMGNLLRDLKNYVQPGMTGKEVDAWVRQEIVKRGATVAYDDLEEKFPGAICISVNDELVHGAPKDEPFEEGDKVSFVTSSDNMQSSQLRCISPIDNAIPAHYNRGRWLALERCEC